MNPSKKYFKTTEETKSRIVIEMGYCIATDRITIDGLKVGYMYRENPDDAQDSGWRFFAGDEADEYVNNPENIGVFDVNTIVHYDNDIIKFLDSPYETSFVRNENGVFEQEDFVFEQEDFL
ncbi:DUF2185 domain-containing protein [Flavobacterium sp. I3-2]|uniref:DUF2185 domain-containing protein n=1 Tax=Flavobacterium sp. I3-2 TaxID=2748319 RepID=UPI0015AFFC08|nr:DUF2185 domain-containing protein [Flavobacterium sp. I3-2]